MTKESLPPTVAPAGRSLRLLCPGGADQVLLAVDSGLGMAEAGFPELMTLADTGFAVWQNAPGSYSVDSWLSDVEEIGLDVHAVLGYCSGASLACAAADEMTERDGRERTVVLFDPVVADTREFWGMYGRFVDPFQEELSKEDIRAARAFARSAVAEIGDDRIALTARLKEGYAEVVSKVCIAADLPVEIEAEFSERFGDQLGLMLAAAEIPLTARRARVAVVLSQDAEDGFPQAKETVRVDVTRQDLFSAPRVAEHVAGILRGMGVTGQ